MSHMTLFEGLTAVLLLASGLLSLIAALGLLRLPEFVQRMHAPALAATFGTWCAALAATVYFSALGSQPELRGALLVVLLAITAPITTTVLARASLFRRRALALLESEREASERDHDV